MKNLFKILILYLLTFSFGEDCCEAEESAIYNCGGIGCYIPQCTPDCNWEPMQCWSSTGYCWCVDEDGVEIDGTNTPSWQGFPDCEEFECISGDVNNDSFLDILDIVVIVDMIMNEDEYDECSNVNADGSLDILDIVLIVSMILGN